MANNSMTPYLNKIIIGKDGIRRKLINVTVMSLEYEWCYGSMFNEISTILRLPETEAYFMEGKDV